jgi:Cof subfamily protein (haloacid dehalogenase superfamily)
MTASIKLLAIDIDGTLQNSRHELTERTEKALKNAVAQGVLVVVATGKARPACVDILQRCGIAAPLICMEGSISYKADGTLRQQQVLNPDMARQIITFAEDRGYTLLANSGERIYVRSHSARIADLLAKYREPAAEVVGPLQNILDDIPFNKLVAMKDGQSVKPLHWQLKMQHNGSVKLTPIMLDTGLQIMPPNTSKGTALKSLMKELKLLPEQVVAIGDAENDLEMFATAGLSVAMGNARQAIKDTATYVVAHCDEDGAAEAIERFVLQSQEKILETEKQA